MAEKLLEVLNIAQGCAIYFMKLYLVVWLYTASSMLEFLYFLRHSLLPIG